MNTNNNSSNSVNVTHREHSDHLVRVFSDDATQQVLSDVLNEEIFEKDGEQHDGEHERLKQQHDSNERLVTRRQTDRTSYCTIGLHPLQIPLSFLS